MMETNKPGHQGKANTHSEISAMLHLVASQTIFFSFSLQLTDTANYNSNAKGELFRVKFTKDT